MKTKKLAEMYGVSRRTIINWIGRGFLIASKNPPYTKTSAWEIRHARRPVQPGQPAPGPLNTTSSADRVANRALFENRSIERTPVPPAPPTRYETDEYSQLPTRISERAEAARAAGIRVSTFGTDDD